MAVPIKDTIYIDVDDEITTIIDKVSSSSSKLVTLVLPKRAAVFQSIVNMKLLKRKSDEAKKNLVLVTSEAGLLPLAGAVGIYVAKNLSTKPEIPEPPKLGPEVVEADEEEQLDAVPAVATAGLAAEEGIDLSKSGSEPIGKLAKEADPSKSKEPATIELDNSDDGDKPVDTAMPPVDVDSPKKKSKKNKGLKVPNFERFRLIAVLGIGGLVALIVLWILIFKVFPHATISIKTTAQNVNTNVNFTLDTTATKANKTTGVLPAKEVDETKTYTASVNATGQQNNGQSASGSVTLSLTDCSKPTVTIPAGTGISTNNLTYITQSTVTLTSVQIGSKCNPASQSNYYSGSTNVTAQSPGSSYNVTNATFSVPGDPNVSGTGSASGGTDDIVTVVSQSDITNAQNKVTTNNSGAQSDLSSQLTSTNYYPLSATFSPGTPAVSPNASAGTAASSVTVTETVKYTMYGTNKSDLTSLLNNNIVSQVGSSQSILNNGLSTGTYSVGANPTSINLLTTAIVGPNINVAHLKKELVGQKAASIQSILQSISGVTKVNVKLSPFYVSKAPGASKITINVAKPTNNPSNG